MKTRRLNSVRTFVIIILALLVVQYEFGIAVNLSNPPKISPLGFSMTKFNTAVMHLALAGQVHASLGTILGILALVTLVLSLRVPSWSVRIFGILGFLAIVVAGLNGILFVQSGFQNDGVSHGMATFFILSFIFYFLELYFLKPERRLETS